MALRRTRWLAVVVVVLAASVVATDVASAKVSTSAAERAAYGLAKKLGQQNGAVLWAAGKCKRKSANHVVCWGAVVYPDYEGCAQQVRVRRARGKTSAKRVGRSYCGDLSQEAEQNPGGGDKGGSDDSGEWAICGIRSSVCVGS